jgi:uncharacterized caspase-like protein
MLTSTERVSAKDKPVADLAIKTLEKCRQAWAPAYSMLPSQASAFIHGVEREQDAVIAELYNGKITFGDYNVAIDRLSGKLAAVLSGIRISTDAGATEKTVQKPPPAEPRPMFHETRLALVIGNSNYANLPKLSNPTNDARSIAEVLQKLGYTTKLLLDASDQSIRSEVRRFANESSKATVALVYYAGHGAQLNGSNYLLPVDIDIPRTEADIQFAGLKVDDLVNSIGSGTKIVFLDACRNNPALFKNIVSGRGASPVGLAPASASNFTTKPGGGVFIAYATDAGSIADDGHGPHSPFTQALLRNIQKPISIDDMFSLVTREVRLVTKNAQRPYKYASLENIVCLTPACSTTPEPASGDIFQQANRSESDELQIAMQTNNIDALEGYLQKYPDTSHHTEIERKIGTIRRSEFKEWTLYEVGNLHNPQFLQLSSIQQFDGRAAVRTKQFLDPAEPKVFNGITLSDAFYEEEVDVYDCTHPIISASEVSFFSKIGKLLYHYKFTDPQYTDLSIGGKTLPAGSVGRVASYIACHNDIATPLVSKNELSRMEFKYLATMVGNQGEIFYKPNESEQSDPNQKKVTVIFKRNKDHNVKEFLDPGTSIPDPPDYRMEVNDLILKCDESKFMIDKTEFWNASTQLVRLSFYLDITKAKFSDFQIDSPFDTLQQIFCHRPYGGIGIRIEPTNGLIGVVEVFDNSPAEKAGLKVHDVISRIDDEAVNNWTTLQAATKLRGPIDTNVNLSIIREGQNNPLEITITRENVQTVSTKLS